MWIRGSEPCLVLGLDEWVMVLEENPGEMLRVSIHHQIIVHKVDEVVCAHSSGPFRLGQLLFHLILLLAGYCTITVGLSLFQDSLFHFWFDIIAF